MRRKTAPRFSSSPSSHRFPLSSPKLASTIPQAHWADKYAEAQATATRATKLELAGSYDAAFKAYITAAQSYLFLIRHTSDAETATRLRGVSGKLVERAERIKAAKRSEVGTVKRDRLSVEEQDGVLERGGAVNGLRLPRWSVQDEKGVPSAAPPGPLEQPPLSPAQLARQCSWRPPAEAFPNAAMYDRTARSSDIVQDNVSDCSLIAALIVAAEHHARFGSKLGLSCLFPQGSDGLPTLSSSGQYSARLLVNGTWRKICTLRLPFLSSIPFSPALNAAIDDKLPVATTGYPMCASSRKHTQLWPSLLEKAYLRLMGGYEFVGSNSANDLYALSSWLPESISLRTGLRSEQTWTRISKGYKLGKCILTLGTGKSTDEALNQAGLVPAHNYAVIGLREEHGRREVVLVNPWRTTSTLESNCWTSGLRAALEDEEDIPGALIVDWDSIATHFASIHLNWDPTVFDHSATVHVSTPASSSTSSKHRHTTQLRLQLDPKPSTPSSEVWLFLARHSASPLEKGEFLGLSVLSAGNGNDVSGASRLKLDDATSMTDNLYFLYRFLPAPSITTYDLLISHEGVSPTFSFSLSAYSNLPLRIEDEPAPLLYSASLQGEWNGPTAGGNHTCHTFLNNPQYCVRLAVPPGTSAAAKAAAVKGELSVTAETGKDSPVNVKLIMARGKRVGDFEDRDILAGVSTYNYGRDALRKTGLSPGSYTLLLSSFTPGHTAPFFLSLKSSLPISVTPIPAEGAGMYARTVKGQWSEGADGGREERERNPRFRIGVKGGKAANVKIRLQLPSAPLPSALFLYSSTPRGEPDQLVASTLPYADPVCGVVLEGTRLEAREEGYLVIPATYTGGLHVPFQILLYADTPVSFE